MRRLAWSAALGLLALLGPVTGTRADSAGELGERLRKATAVLGEMAAGKEDTAIPREMLARARAIAVFPQVKKGASVMSVKRTSDGRWSAPAFFTVGGGSFGLSSAAR